MRPCAWSTTTTAGTAGEIRYYDTFSRTTAVLRCTWNTYNVGARDLLLLPE